MKKLALLCVAVATLALGLPLVGPAAAQSPAAPAGRETEPVILTGANFPEWATVGDVALEQPHTEGAQCLAAENGSPEEITPEETCSHNTFEDPDFSSGDYRDDTGVAIDKLLGYQWNGNSFEQIPFQVDEMFVHYMSNNKSGFAFYSQTDQHTTYAFDYDRYSWTASDPDNPCLSAPASSDDPLVHDPERKPLADPIQGLDTDDEVVFMADDAAVRAPADAPLPPGVTDSYEVALTDPSAQGATRYAYVMLAGGEKPATARFTADNGYVRYERDSDADVFLFSESSYDNYGAAPEGPWFDPATGICHTAENQWRQRRPGDQAWIYTPRYKFRYSGRWVMNELHVSDRDEDGQTQTFADLGDLPDDWYGPDLIDQWKARAFQQRPSGETPCCGYEEEVNNWGGSSMLMGERVGPVRVIRESWGADSSTNLARREIFYRDEIRLSSFLRVHVIPPLDGIYAQWDYNLGSVQKYYNPIVSEGVDIDGQNDEAFGNSRLHIGRDGVSYDGDDTTSDQIDEVTGSDTQSVGSPNEPRCSYPGDPLEEQYDAFRSQIPDPIGGELPGDVVDLCIYNDIDSPDPAFSGVNAGLNWEEIAGEHGTLVLRSAIKQFTPGVVQGMAAVPYYRDDACFDDGTGNNPGPHVDGRDVDGDDADDSTYIDESGVERPRECWEPNDPIPAAPDLSDRRFYQGSIGTHGVHILLIADSDNAGTTLPVTEIDTEQRMVVLQPTLENVGDLYGRANEKPLVAVAVPESRTPGVEPEQQVTTLVITGDRSGQVTDSATLSALLTSGGTGVAGKEIVFTLDGQEVGRGVTDANGTASVTTTLQPPARQTTQTATFGGDDDHVGSSAEDGFDLRLDDSALSLSSAHQGNRSTVTASLTEVDGGTGLAGRTIRFFLNGVEVAVATTEASGSASSSFRTKKGDTFRVVFEGDDSFAGSAAEGKR